ncbi:AraC family transcriptional regulator [Pseudorhodoferax sp. LjRoot39]|uniref:helix-turn-helix domain-containing protein n=1 Tax=Pseudorhodoferax sp. LjRoot39 TaxID=3342328 RepID=UPI003ECC606E
MPHCWDCQLAQNQNGVPTRPKTNAQRHAQAAAEAAGLHDNGAGPVSKSRGSPLRSLRISSLPRARNASRSVSHSRRGGAPFAAVVQKAADEHLVLSAQSPHIALGASLDHRLRAAIAHMRAHVSDKATIDDIAGRVGLSRGHLFALFRDQLNTTPQVFWRAVRVEEAMRRVGDGAPLTDVALDLGFSAPGNFSRFFKEHTGVSPSIFRRAVRAPMPSTVTGVPRKACRRVRTHRSKARLCRTSCHSMSELSYTITHPTTREQTL